jgi:NAD(P)-dependent dehydrogenase (short-subunit alcohol dehydrogenase family)
VDLSPEDFQATMGTNLLGTFLCLKHELEVMSSQGSGGVVNVSSVNAVRPAPTASLYCASKVGVEMLTQVAALEHGHQGIRVNTVRPGLVITPMHEMLLDRMGGPTPENIERMESRVPLHRRAEPEEIGEAVAWLFSDDARYVTGETITVDGGVTYA